MADLLILSLCSVNADFQMRIGRGIDGRETLPAHDVVSRVVV